MKQILVDSTMNCHSNIKHICMVCSTAIFLSVQGASSSASIFQGVMDKVLKGMDNVDCYLDDVLIAGKNMEKCKGKLYLVLQRLAEEKCKFFVNSLNYLGHVISEKGLLPCNSKIATLQNAKATKTVTELTSFLGLINYYNKFIPHLSTKLRYLYNLLKNGVKFVWDVNCSKAFNESKKSKELLSF